MNGVPKTRVLIADGSDVRIGLMTHLFRLNDWAEIVAVAKDGFEALDKVSKFALDALILDADLPVLNGFGVLKALRERSVATKVVLCSKDDLSGCYSKLGADAFLGRFDPLSGLSHLVRDLAHSEMSRSGKASLASTPLWQRTSVWGSGESLADSWRAYHVETKEASLAGVSARREGMDLG